MLILMRETEQTHERLSHKIYNNLLRGFMAPNISVWELFGGNEIIPVSLLNVISINFGLIIFTFQIHYREKNNS